MMVQSAATTLEAIEEKLVSVIAAITGLPVVNERKAGKYPNGPFVSFMLAREEGTDWPEREYVDPPEVLSEVLTDPVYCTAQITAYGNGAFSALNKFRLLTRSANRNFDLFQLVGLGGCDDVQNITTELGANRIPAASVNFHFNVLISETAAIDFFKAARVTVLPDGNAENAMAITVPETQES